MNIFVAGAGVISAIGKGKAESLDALEKGRAGMGPMQRLQSIHPLPVAEVPYSNAQLAQIACLPETAPRTALLSAIAAAEALQQANLPSGIRIGFISANTIGGMDKTEVAFPNGKLRNFQYHECGSVTEMVADRLGITHHVSTISTACSSSANAIFFGARLIRHGYLDAVVAGGADALAKFTLNGFNTLMILDSNPCKPFDEHRQGLNLGEGAGYLVLTSEKITKSPSATLSGYANANDAYHQTASSPGGQGSLQAMREALKKANLKPGDIDYINLHGTGTQNNDISEGSAIQTLFDPDYPPMSSTKSFTGHTLGGSGGIEAVFSIMALEGGYLYPNLRLETPMKELPFSPITTFQKGVNVRHVLSNSFGFGGNCSSLIFSKV